MRLPILGADKRVGDKSVLHGEDLGVALVYPPYGPPGLPNLGLALLSAGVKARGLRCRTFYWNLDLVAEMPGEDLARKLETYRILTGRGWTPFNEWSFAELVHGDALQHRESETRRDLAQRLAAVYARPSTRARYERGVLSVRERAGEIVSAMADRLAPYGVIGISSTFYQNLPALALAKHVKKRWPEKIVILGGANCDGEMGPALLRKFDFLDLVFVGEADHAFPELAARLCAKEGVDDIPGVLRRDGEGEIHTGPPAEPLADLDSLPLPDFDDFLAERKRVGIDVLQPLTLALESSRGCWWGARQHCTFCGLNANGMGYRQKTDHRFRWEIEEIVNRYGARFIFMADNILPMRYFDHFMDWAARSDLGVKFFYEIKANMSRSQVARLARAGVTGVQPGIESFSSSVLSLMRKGTTGIQNIAFLKYTREYGIFTTYNFLVGFPGEDEAEYDRLAGELRKIFHLRPPSGAPEIEFHRFSPYHQSPDAFGIRLRPSSRYGHIYPFPEHELARIAYMFEREDAATLPPRRYLDKLAREVMRWHETFDEGHCTLTWESDGADVVVKDRRPSFPARRYRLRGHAAVIFHATDFPKSMKMLLKDAGAHPEDDGVSNLLAFLFTSPPPEGEIETLIQFDRDEFLEDLGGCLRPLVEAGLLYVEGDHFLSLPVHRDYRPTDNSWLHAGV